MKTDLTCKELRQTRPACPSTRLRGCSRGECLIDYRRVGRPAPSVVGDRVDDSPRSRSWPFMGMRTPAVRRAHGPLRPPGVDHYPEADQGDGGEHASEARASEHSCSHDQHHPHAGPTWSGEGEAGPPSHDDLAGDTPGRRERDHPHPPRRRSLPATAWCWRRPARVAPSPQARPHAPQIIASMGSISQPAPARFHRAIDLLGGRSGSSHLRRATRPRHRPMAPSRLHPHAVLCWARGMAREPT